MVSVSRREDNLRVFFLTESERVSRVEGRVLTEVKKVLSQCWGEQAGVSESTAEN